MSDEAGKASPKRLSLGDALEMAQGYFEAGDLARAESLLDKLLAVKPDYGPTHNLMGGVRAQQGRFEAAVEHFAAAVAAGPVFPGLYINLASALERLERIDEALDAYQQAVALAPDNPAAHYNLGVVLQRHGRFERAVVAFEAALAGAPGNADALSGLGAALQSLARYDAAVDAYEAALKEQPDHPEALNNLGIIHQIDGRHDLAVACFERAAELLPDSVETLVNLGRGLMDAERLDEAGPLLERAVSARPDFQAAILARAQLAEKQGDTSAALADYRRALELAPSHLPTRLHLSQLNGRTVPRWHFPMVNDEGRNRAYDRAIRRVVKAGDRVLDIGTGTGLLAMMAARAGAGRVYACEMVESIAHTAETIIAANELADIISVTASSSTALQVGVELPARCDVLVCEIFDVGLLCEGVVPVLEHAKRELLTDNARILPRGAVIEAMLVESRELWDMNRVDRAAGFDVSAFNAFSNAVYDQLPLRRYEHRRLSDPIEVFAFDFQGPPILDQKRTIEITPSASGTVHAVVFWFRLQLDDEITFSTAPDNESCWNQAVQTLGPMTVEAGRAVELTASHDGNVVVFAAD